MNVNEKRNTMYDDDNKRSVTNLFAIIGKSATGKSTVSRMACDMLQAAGVRCDMIIMYTTRPMRSGEINGKDYMFITASALDELDEAGKLIVRRDYSTVHGVWSYAMALDEQLDDDHDDNIKIAVMTPASLQSVMRKNINEESIAESPHIVVHPIIIQVNDDTRLERATMRESRQKQPDYAEMRRRISSDEKDFEGVVESIPGIKIISNESEDPRECASELVRYIMQAPKR